MKFIIQALEGHKIFFVKKTIDKMDSYIYIYIHSNKTFLHIILQKSIRIEKKILKYFTEVDTNREENIKIFYRSRYE